MKHRTIFHFQFSVSYPHVLIGKVWMYCLL